jgi:hypothetical protein
MFCIPRLGGPQHVQTLHAVLSRPPGPKGSTVLTMVLTMVAAVAALTWAIQNAPAQPPYSHPYFTPRPHSPPRNTPHQPTPYNYTTITMGPICSSMRPIPATTTNSPPHGSHARGTPSKPGTHNAPPAAACVGPHPPS